MPIIEIQNLTYIYGIGTPFEKKALDGVSLTVEKGEMIGIIGHTGSGKSTLVQHLNGLFKPYSGKVYIDGKDISGLSEAVIKDREILGESGIVLVSASLSKKTKKLISGPEITTRGFIYVKDSSEIIDEIKKISIEVIEHNSTDTYVDYNKIKQEIRERLGNYFYSETESKPMIIAVIQEV